jgi:hypothetical protein
VAGPGPAGSSSRESSTYRYRLFRLNDCGTGECLPGETVRPRGSHDRNRRSGEHMRGGRAPSRGFATRLKKENVYTRFG